MDFKIDKIQNRAIHQEASILEALKMMDRIDKKLLIVLEGDEFLGLLSAGDIQRAIIHKASLETPIKEILRDSIRVAGPQDSFDDIRNLMLVYRMEFCPVISEAKKVLEVHFWEDLFEKRRPAPIRDFELPVVIMAGGMGTRLKPLTNVLPKPLIPLGEKTIIEEIFRRFNDHGSSRFFLSVNYKADLIEFYLKSQALPYSLSFIKEHEPRGTAGSLSLLKDKVNETFFVSNCDIIIDQDYSEILDYHRNSKNELTIVAALKHYKIPYGTVETGEGGELLQIKEKPDLSVWVNTGMYVLEPSLLANIPDNGFFHITQLIENLRIQKRKVGVFPVSEGSWMDTGEWDEYNKTQKKVNGE